MLPHGLSNTACKDVLILFWYTALDESLGIVSSKAVMTFFCEKIPELEKSVAKPMCLFTLSKMQSRSVSFEEQVT